MKDLEYISKQNDNLYHLFVRLTPNAKQEKIDGIFYDENHQAHLKIYTTVIPEDNKANKQLIKIISKHFKIPKSSIELIRGSKSRCKVLQINK